MLLSIEDNMEPTLEWLQHRLSLTNEQLSKVIQKRPTIISLSIIDNTEPKLDWLQHRLSLSDEELSKMIQRYTALFNYNVEGNLEPKLVWIQDRLSLTDEQLTTMIQHLPALLGYDIHNNLEPTLDFYINVLGDESEAISFVTKNPSSFGFSLEKRLKPRLEEAQSIGMKIDYTCLYYITRHTNDEWNRKVAKVTGKV